MSLVVPTPIPPFVGALPDPADKASYGPRGRAFWEYEVQVLALAMNLIAGQTQQNAEHAQSMALLAEAFADFKGPWSSLTGALSTPALVSHSGTRWFLLNNLTDVTASEPGVSADWEEEPELAAGLVGFDPAGLDAVYQGQAPINVQQAIVCALAGPNLVDNWEMRNAIRRFGSTPPQTYTAGQFVIDRWKAGAGGLTRGDHTNNVDGSIRVLSGSLVHSIPMQMGLGESVCVAWDGFAKARVNGGPYLASPIVFTASANISQVDVEFYNDGTGGAQSGSVSKLRVRRGLVDLGTGPARTLSELQLYLSRYAQRVKFDRQANMAAGETDRTFIGFSRMVAVPTASLDGAAEQSVNVSSVSMEVFGGISAALIITATNAAATRYRATYFLDTGI